MFRDQKAHITHPNKLLVNMVKAHIERIIDVPIDEAWELVSDFAHVNVIHPLVGTVDQITPDKSRGLGAVRKCHLYDGNHAVEKIVEWDEANKTYLIRLIDGSLPMKVVLAKLTAEAYGRNKTKLSADMDLQAKYGLLGKIMERLVIKPKLGGALGDLFAGVEYHSKTGKDVQKGFKAKTPALVQ